MDVLQNAEHILQDLTETLKRTDSKQVANLLQDIQKADRIFVMAAGRSLLMMKAFAMRLMHLGRTVYVVGETTTPSITSNDLLIAGTASGETATLQVMARKAKKIGVKMDTITIYKGSTIAELSDHIIVLPASTNQVSDGASSWQPGGNSFEQSLLILLDSIIISLAAASSINLHNALTLHANLE